MDRTTTICLPSEIVDAGAVMGAVAMSNFCPTVMKLTSVRLLALARPYMSILNWAAMASRVSPSLTV